MPEHTGHALCALAGSVQNTEIAKSIEYSQKSLSSLQTPFSLCWALFGLSAWSMGPEDVEARVVRSLLLQEKYGAYDTTLLAQLLIAYTRQGGRGGLITAARDFKS
jgi:hypothetical protein